MGILDVILLSAALAMDACAVGMTNGMTDCKMPVKKVLLIGVFFGFFQFLMPVIGYFITGLVANNFKDAFEKISAWISFGLLAFLGGKMLWESIREMREKKGGNSPTVCPVGADGVNKCRLTVGKLTMQAIATSIDALAVGISLKAASLSSKGLAMGVWGATGAIGVVTLALTVCAVYIGKAVGDKLSDKAGLFGGLVLIGIGVKLLIEGLL